MQINYRDPKTFWQDVKQLMGSANTTIPYLISSQGKKLYTDQEKEEECQQIWTNIF